MRTGTPPGFAAGHRGRRGRGRPGRARPGGPSASSSSSPGCTTATVAVADAVSCGAASYGLGDDGGGVLDARDVADDRRGAGVRPRLARVEDLVAVGVAVAGGVVHDRRARPGRALIVDDPAVAGIGRARRSGVGANEADRARVGDVVGVDDGSTRQHHDVVDGLGQLDAGLERGDGRGVLRGDRRRRRRRVGEDRVAGDGGVVDERVGRIGGRDGGGARERAPTRRRRGWAPRRGRPGRTWPGRRRR